MICKNNSINIVITVFNFMKLIILPTVIVKLNKGKVANIGLLIDQLEVPIVMDSKLTLSQLYY